MKYTDYKGVYCHVIWGNEDPEYYYISFGDYDYENNPTYDSFGVRDEQVFYYLSSDEAQALLECMENVIATCAFDDDWYIDLAMGYELETL
jgi:hypothetical protein